MEKEYDERRKGSRNEKGSSGMSDGDREDDSPAAKRLT
jgi:hypothetical protein